MVINVLRLMARNEAGILTARKDKDFIEREELLEALKRVRQILWIVLIVEALLYQMTC